MGTSMCIWVNGHIGSETKQGEVYGASVVGGSIGHKVHKGWAEGPDLAPVGSKAFKWGTSRIRVGVGLETLGTCCGREVGDQGRAAAVSSQRYASTLEMKTGRIEEVLRK